MNRIFLTGSLGRDPEAKYSNGGMAITKFSLAVNGGFGDKKRTDWFNVVCFNKTAETMGNCLHKGSKILVEGEVQMGSYTNKEGRKVYTTDVIAQHIEFLDSKKKDDSNYDMGSFGKEVTPDEEIPF